MSLPCTFLTLFFSCLLSLPASAQKESWIEHPVLFTSEGQAAYGTVRAQGPLSEAQDSQGMVAVNHKRRVRQGRTGWNTISGSLRVQASTLTTSVPSLSRSLQGVERSLKAGSIVLREDNRIYQILNVFADGRVAAIALEVSRVSRHRLPGTNLAPSRLDQAHHIFPASEIKAVTTEEFRVSREQSYRLDRRYRMLGNLPICDTEALSRYQLPPGLRSLDDLRFSCGRDEAGDRIDALFTDGTMAFGNKVFNPFPEALQKYTEPGARENLEGAQD